MLEMEAVQYKGFRNLYDENGEAVGFQVCIRFSAYRGPWLSQFRFRNITVDGEVFGPEVCTFTHSGIEYTYEEMLNAGFVKWQLDDVGIVKVRKPGGLSQGSHTVSADFSEIASYLPPFLDEMGGYGHPVVPRELIIV
ncbi:MAG: D-mannonate dehydratase [Oscillospiraceae bacterium]|nr:D-mannonate dehydratase [Oscillospiraceae bacterium]